MPLFSKKKKKNESHIEPLPLQSQHSLNQSMEKTGTPGQGRARTNSMEEAAKRNSYGNQSFRTAVQQQQPGGGGGPGAPPRQGRQPPAVPPKPGSR